MTAPWAPALPPHRPRRWRLQLPFGPRPPGEIRAAVILVGIVVLLVVGVVTFDAWARYSRDRDRWLMCQDPAQVEELRAAMRDFARAARVDLSLDPIMRAELGREDAALTVCADAQPPRFRLWPGRGWQALRL